jgi:ribosome recycling factor
MGSESSEQEKSMTGQQINKDTKERMEKALDVLRNEMKGLRTGRATPALLDAIRVEYFGSPTPVKQLANITTPEATQILIKPFDTTALKDIEKAIRASDLGLAPNNDGKVIRLQIPPMSGDQRNKLAKKIKELTENAKVSCRNIRRDGNKHYDDGEKAKTMTEDEVKKGKEEIQNLLKTYELKLDEVAAAKTKEVMEQ